MNLRFTNSSIAKQLADMPVHSRTGLRAIGVGRRGPIWPVAGGAEDDVDGEGSDSDSDDDEESDDSDDDSDDVSGGKGSDGDRSKGKRKKKIDSDGDDDKPVYTEADYNRLKARMQAADRRATDTEKRLKGLEDKDKPADVKMKARLEETLKELETTKEARKKDLIQLAFLRANDVEWHDPDDALTMADLSEVEIDDEGSVDRKALKAALRDLAKRKPHLVKTKESKEDEEEENEEEQEDQRSKSSGSKMAGNRKGSKGKGPTREDLAKRFPALRRR